jgi:hypothetical protein
MSHYDYLDKHLPDFFKALGLDWETHRGIIQAHGDKCYSYRQEWEEAGIPFAHGVALYLLTYCYPFDVGVRQTDWGWVAPKQWVIEQYPRYGQHLPPVD